MSVSKRLKEARIALNFSQEQLAEILGISFRAYNNYETDKRSLKIELVEKLAQNYRLNPSWLLIGQGPMFLTTKTDKQQKYEHAFSERNTFGKRLNYYQAEENLTDKEIAKILKTTESRIEQLGCDEKEPTLQELKELKLHSGVSIDLWIFGADNEPASGCILNLSEDERKMLEFLKKAKENKLI